MNSETFFNELPYIMLWNTLPVVWFAGLCFFWAWMCRTGAKKIIFSGVGGALMAYCLLRIVAVFALPVDLNIVTLTGIAYGVVMMLAASVFTVATVIAHKRGEALVQVEKSRSEAADSDLAQTLQGFEERLVEFGKAHGFV